MTCNIGAFVCGIGAVKTSSREIATTKVTIVERQADDVKISCSIHSFFGGGRSLQNNSMFIFQRILLSELNYDLLINIGIIGIKIYLLGLFEALLG